MVFRSRRSYGEAIQFVSEEVLMSVRSLALIVVLVFGTGAARAAEEKEITLEGEIVDMHCYLTKHGGEGKGAAHAGCANACLSRGVTAGFLAKDGTLYVLFDEKMISPKDKLADLAGRPVTATGFVVERDGVKAFRLVKVSGGQ
jgi:hypothetical protein